MSDLPVTERLTRDLRKRMAGPQRHRLLQGYPQPPLMKHFDRITVDELIEPNHHRPLLVGVLPHAACNPTVRGCGYCTFPHEEFRLAEVRDTVAAVVKEIKASPVGWNRVPALYFGGGTANLTPPDLFTALCQTLRENFDLKEAEVTLEGAPAYFTSRKESLLDILERELPCPERRISMGVQTFDTERIAAMGRQHMGGPEAVEKAVRAAQRRGITSSADLMINMPGQTVEQMKEDVRRASDLGFSQLSIYHLVMFKGLGVPWAHDHQKLASLPDNRRALDNWLEVRALAQSLGYQQSTLTNFQREGRFRYEDCSYQPEAHDWVGYGPEALSCFTDFDWHYAVKWMNQTSGETYREAMRTRGDACERYFLYSPLDMRLLHLTRRLARLHVRRETYQNRHRSDLVEDFSSAWRVLEAAELVLLDEHEVRLTDKGMFFADSVVGLLASERVAEIRQGDVLEDVPIVRMG